jgi:hypothetical protein
MAQPQCDSPQDICEVDARKDGYVIMKNFIPEEVIAAIKADVDKTKSTLVESQRFYRDEAAGERIKKVNATPCLDTGG